VSGLKSVLLIALAVNIYQQWAQVAEQRLRSELIVNEISCCGRWRKVHAG